MNFGTIGTSWITKMYTEAALISGRWRYVKAYSRDKEKAREFTKPFGNVACYDDMEEFAQNLDAVYIASPNMLHASQAEFFLKRKVNVICEKPITANYEQFKNLPRLAEENGVYIIEAFRHIQKPSFAAIKDNLNSIGQLRQVNLKYNQYSSRYDLFKKGEVTNIFSRSFAGGALMDIGIYPLSFCVALFGEPKDSRYKPVKLSNGIDGCGTLILDYGDFLATLIFSKITVEVSPSDAENKILGEDGGIVFDHITGFNHVKMIRQDKELILASPITENDMRYEAEAFYDIIKNRDDARYRELLAISDATMRILDKSRAQGGIFWEVLEDGYSEKTFRSGTGQQG